MARTDNLTNFLTDVATAIKTKKGDDTPIQASSFDTEIANLPSGGKFAPPYVKFNNYNGIELDLSNLDTINVTNMSGMFSYCINITSLDVGDFNTSNVASMSSMFSNCRKLSELNISNFNTSNVTNMNDMFGGCSNLISLNLGNLNTSNVTNMSYMFQACSKLTIIDISCLDTSSVTNMDRMFQNCGSLSKIIINRPNIFNLLNTNVFTGTPMSTTSSEEGYIYVPDNLVNTYKSTTNWSALADRIKPISELEGYNNA